MSNTEEIVEFNLVGGQPRGLGAPVDLSEDSIQTFK
jgi:hypothetical protein